VRLIHHTSTPQCSEHQPFPLVRQLPSSLILLHCLYEERRASEPLLASMLNTTIRPPSLVEHGSLPPSKRLLSQVGSSSLFLSNICSRRFSLIVHLFGLASFYRDAAGGAVHNLRYSPCSLSLEPWRPYGHTTNSNLDSTYIPQAHHPEQA
jgi:hypothetical protein